MGILDSIKRFPIVPDRIKPFGKDKVALLGEGPIPPKWSWLNLAGDIWDQLTSGPCAGYAAMKAVMIQHQIQFGRVCPLPSRIWPYTIARIIDEVAVPNPLKQVGTTMRGICDGLWRFGMVSELAWPSGAGWEGHDRGMQADLRVFDAAFANRIDSFEAIQPSPASSEAIIEGIKFQLLKHPVLVGMVVYEGWMNPGPSGLVHATGAALGGHALCLAAYDDRLRQFGFPNSWGPEWGADGTGWIRYDEFFLSIMSAWVIQLKHEWREVPIQRK